MKNPTKIHLDLTDQGAGTSWVTLRPGDAVSDITCAIPTSERSEVLSPPPERQIATVVTDTVRRDILCLAVCRSVLAETATNLYVQMQDRLEVPLSTTWMHLDWVVSGSFLEQAA